MSQELWNEPSGFTRTSLMLDWTPSTFSGDWRHCDVGLGGSSRTVSSRHDWIPIYGAQTEEMDVGLVEMGLHPNRAHGVCGVELKGSKMDVHRASHPPADAQPNTW